MKLKGYNYYLIEKFINSNIPTYLDMLESIDIINEESGTLTNWLFIAPKIKRLMKKSNELRIQKVQAELDLDETIRKFNIDFQDDLDKTRESWGMSIKKLRDTSKKDETSHSIQDKIDKYKENLASKLSSMKDAHKVERNDINDTFDRKVEAYDDDIEQIEKEAEELSGDSEYLNKIRRALKLQGIVDANKLKIEGASDTEAKRLLDKSSQYKKEIETLSKDIKSAIEDKRDEISWSEED